MSGNDAGGVQMAGWSWPLGICVRLFVKGSTIRYHGDFVQLLERHYGQLTETELTEPTETAVTESKYL